MTGPLGLGEPRLKSQRIYYVIALRSPGPAGQSSASRAVASRTRPHGRIFIMLRWLTAGESHGRALVAICEGITAGGRHGRTLGGPVAIRVANTEWPKWDVVMSPDPVDVAELGQLARAAPL